VADHPEFNTEHTPQGLMVWVPVPYFDSLCRKAYGTQYHPQNPEAVPTEPEADPQGPEALPLEYVPPMTAMASQGYAPRGYAAAKEAASHDD